MKSSIMKYLDVFFVIKFLLLFLLLYYFHIFFLGLTSRGGNLYMSTLDHQLNYISWFTDSILLTASVIDKAFGLHSYLTDLHVIRSESGIGVQVWLPCLGLGNISFWIAFVIAHKRSWQNKIWWGLIGVCAIWFINCWRIAILLLALDRNWAATEYIDHHDLFNVIAYILIMVLIYLYSRKDEQIHTHHMHSHYPV